MLLVLRATEACRIILFSVRINFGLYIIPLVTENFWLCMRLWLIFLSSVWAYVSSRCCLKFSKVNDTTWHEILQCHVKTCCLQPKSIKLPETFCKKNALMSTADVAIQLILCPKFLRHVRIIAKSDYELRVCPPAWNNSAPTRRIIMEFDNLGVFKKSFEEILVSCISDKNNGYCTRRCLYIYDDNISLNSSWNEDCFRQKL
jgi:hypothetical protein